MPAAAFSLLIVADNRGPTQVISFERPLQALVDAGRCRISWITERELVLVAKRTKGVEEKKAAVRAAIDATWDAAAPCAVIFSRYGGPAVDHLLARTAAAGIPSLAHLDVGSPGTELEFAL